MKRYLVIILTVCMLFLCAGCSGNFFAFSDLYGMNYEDQYDDFYSIPETSSDYLDYASDYVDDYVSSYDDFSSSYIPSDSNHTHFWFDMVTKEATCGSTGIRTYSCSCGESYTEIIEKSSYHSWQSATCTAPRTCEDCGMTSGTANDHSYYSDGKCGSCGQTNPTITQTLSQCYLVLPSLPKTVIEYNYDNTAKTKLDVTAVTYKFDCDNEGKIELEVFFSGTKTYDSRGAGQSDSGKIGWKLFAPDGSVFDSGTFYSPAIAVGESFSNKGETLLYSWDNGVPGQYRLEIMNVN